MDIEVKSFLLKQIQVISLREFIESLYKPMPYDFRIECGLHQKPFSSFCLCCKLNCCVDCVENHSKHPLTPAHCPKHLEDYNEELFVHNKALNREFASEIIIKLEKDQQIFHIRNIMSEHETNEQINSDLEVLYQSILKTASAFKATPSYELMQHQLITQAPEKDIRRREFGLGFKRNGWQPIEEQEIEAEYRDKLDFRNNYYLEQGRTQHYIGFLQGHEKKVSCVLLLQNGRLASCAKDKTIKIWDLVNKTRITTKRLNEAICQLYCIKGRSTGIGFYKWYYYPL